MLPRRPVIAVPDLFKGRVPPEVVNVPVGAAGLLHVIREPGADASGAEGAADVYVESGLEPQPTMPPDPDEPVRPRRKHQGIRPRFGFDHREFETRPILSLGGAHRSKVHNCPQPKP